MTTATRRLRRGGIAGIAAFATASVAVIATAGTAFATLGTLSAQIDPTNGATTVYPGESSAPLGNLDLNLTNSFNIGDTIKVDIAGGDCTTTGKAIGFVGTPTVTANGPFTNAFNNPTGVVADSNFVLPTFTVTTQSAGAGCSTAGVKDEVLITFTNSAKGTATDNIELVVGGQTVNVGSAVVPGGITETATPSNGLPAGPVTVATVSNFKVSTSVVGAAPSAAGVALNAITVTDVPGGNIAGTIVFTLGNGGKFAKAPSLTTPSGVTASAAAEAATLPSATLTYTLTGTTPANGVYTLSGATANLSSTPADTAVTVTYDTNVADNATVPDPTPAVTVGSGNVAVTANSTRKSGADRYATAASLFPAAATKAVLASGLSYPDALSANFLAGVAPAGILLTDPSTLSTAASTAITSHNVTTVYIIGGTAAVSSAVEDAVAAMHVGGNSSQPLITVVRLAGADRYATNQAVDLYTINHFGWDGRWAFVATGENFADALSIGPAVAKGEPLVLTPSADLNATAKQTLTDLALNGGVSHAVIVGGTAAVSASVASAIPSTGMDVQTRLAGAERTGTSAAIASWEVTNIPFVKTTVNLARGDDFPDALAAGVFAGSLNQPILLTASPTDLGPGAPTFLAGNGGTTVNFTVLGGTAAVSDSTVTAAIAALG